MAEGTFDSDDYDLHLAAERARRAKDMLALSQPRSVPVLRIDDSLNLGIVNFDPSEHPRDLFGKFRNILGGMKKGQSVQTPDGVSVTKYGEGFIVNAKGEATKVTNVANAADFALDKSKSTSYKSKIAKVAKAIRPVVTQIIENRAAEQKFNANSELITIAAKAAGGVVTAKSKTDVAKALGGAIARSYSASKKKTKAESDRELASWLVDMLFGKLSGLDAGLPYDANSAPLEQLNLSQWYSGD